MKNGLKDKEISVKNGSQQITSSVVYNFYFFFDKKSMFFIHSANEFNNQ